MISICSRSYLSYLSISRYAGSSLIYLFFLSGLKNRSASLLTLVDLMICMPLKLGSLSFHKMENTSQKTERAVLNGAEFFSKDRVKVIAHVLYWIRFKFKLLKKGLI